MSSHQYQTPSPAEGHTEERGGRGRKRREEGERENLRGGEELISYRKANIYMYKTYFPTFVITLNVCFKVMGYLELYDYIYVYIYATKTGILKS